MFKQEVKARDGAIHKPSWLQVLEIEYQIRKKAHWLANTHKLTIKAALVRACSGD